MILSKITPVACATLIAVAAAPLAAQSAQTATPTDAGLAADTLTDGRTMQAIAQLQSELDLHPGDPAILINLGIAQAQSGQEQDARISFEAAMRSRDVIELETANGTSTDSRRLARHALAMLDRGEFRPARRSAEQFTLRD